MNCCNSTASGDDRRGFCGKLFALAGGAVALLTPLGVGLAAFLHPLRKKADGGGFVRVTTLAAVPDDGVPRKFAVVTDRVDAWTRFANEPVGAVFLRRQKGATTITALQAECPHAGCAVNYDATAGGQFLCPCHIAHFGLDGARTDAVSPSPRDMDPLDVELRGEKKDEVWVRFQAFVNNQAERVVRG